MNKAASHISTSDATYNEENGVAKQYNDLYSSEQDFASGDIALNRIKGVPDKSSLSINDSEIRSTFAGDNADVQFQMVPGYSLQDTWNEPKVFSRLIDKEHLESIARMPATGDEFARLTPDPDPWYDNDTSFVPTKALTD